MRQAPPQLQPGDRRELDKELIKARAANALFGGSRSISLASFELVRRLGWGAKGSVYEARDARDGGVVALKLFSGWGAGPYTQLKHEFRVLADVVHPNLVNLYELFVEPPHLFFTMERVEGARLDAWVRDDASGVNDRRLRAALAQLSRGVEAIHSADTTHGDLKPSNVLVTASGRVVLLDFGLAAQLAATDGEPGASAGARLSGTPGYMAPELFAQSPRSAASDWYAVGAMLFEVLTRKLPTEHSAAMVAAGERTSLDPRECVPTAAPDLSALCAALLDPDAAVRATGRDILRVLGEPRGVRAIRRPARRRRVFVGRDSELAQLRSALDHARGGRAVIALLAGRSGIGKTVLLERFCHEAADGGALVLHGRCHERESSPFNVFDGVLDALLQHLQRTRSAALTRLLPAQARALGLQFPALAELLPASAQTSAGPDPRDARELRHQAFAALKTLLLQVSRDQPLVLAVDDLQWGDIDSARMLQHVIDPPGAPALLFVGSLRADDDPAHGGFMRALCDAHAPAPPWAELRLALQPLEPDVARRCARALLPPDAPDALVARIAAEGDGEPFFISELAAAVAESAVAGIPCEQEAGLSLDQLIMERASALPAAAGHLLYTVSLCTGPVALELVYRAAGLQAADRSPALALQVARLARRGSGERGPTLEPYHDRIRDIVRRQLSPQEQRGFHARLARALSADAEHNAESLWVHYRGAGDDLNAGRSALVAAHTAAAKLAFNRAADLLRVAIECLPSDEVQRLDLQRQLGDALANAGRCTLAAEAFVQAAEPLSGASRRAVRARAAQEYMRGGKGAQGVALARSVIAELGVRVPTGPRLALGAVMVERARLQLRGLQLRRGATPSGEERERVEVLSQLFFELSSVDTLLGFNLQTRALREALRIGDVSRAAKGLIWEAFNAALVGGARNEAYAERVLQRARPLVEEVGSPFLRGLEAMVGCAQRLYANRDFQRASRLAEQASACFADECQSAFIERGAADFFHTVCLDWTGEYLRCGEYGARLLAESRERDDDAAMLLGLSAWASRCLTRDEPEAALAFLDEQRERIAIGYTPFRHFSVLSRAITAVYMRDGRTGWELVRGEWPAFRRSHFYHCRSMLAGHLEVRARCALAAYQQSNDPVLRADLLKTLAQLRRWDAAYGAQARGFGAVLGAHDGHAPAALEQLDESATALGKLEAYGKQRITERATAALRRDWAGVERIDAGLRAQGVVNPERFAFCQLPMQESAGRGL